MRLVHSSVPGAVQRDQAIHLLIERAVLTRLVCRELLDVADDLPNRRAKTALFLLLQWIGGNLPQYVRGEPYPMDGIDQMIVPDGCEKLLEEIRSGALVAQALFLYLMADSAADKAKLPSLLASYWKQHGAPVQVSWFAD
jgi:hypothetical protein